MALLPRDKTPTRSQEAEVINVSPDQVFQKDPAPKRFWELSFDGHVTNMMLASFGMAFVMLAGFIAFMAWATHLFD
jgi:hypothetical protein